MDKNWHIFMAHSAQNVSLYTCNSWHIENS